MRAATVERGDVQALRVNRHRDELCARRPKRAMGAEVTGLLDRDAVIRLEQRGGSEPERRLRSGHDEYLFGLAPDRPGGTEMLGDSDPKARASPAGSPYANRSAVSART